MADRIKRARTAEPKWDRWGLFAERCGELGREVGIEAHVLYEEHCERAQARYMMGGLTVDQAEEMAWADLEAAYCREVA